MRDPRLPFLEEAIDAEKVAAKFAASFRETLTENGLKVKKCVVERVQHKKGKRCRILYTLFFQNENGEETRHWFHGKMVKQGRGAQHFEAALQKLGVVDGLWPAVSLWEEWDFVLWAFPYDPDMPGLNIPAIPTTVKSIISENTAKFDFDENCVPEDVKIDQVKYMPAKRCVLRYNVVFRKGDAAQDLTFYGKVYPDGTSRYHYEVLKTVYRSAGNILNVPAPILHLDDANTIWQHAWPGEPLIDKINEISHDEIFPRLGEIAAKYHRTKCAGLPKHFNFKTVMFAAKEDAKMLGWMAPHFKQRLDQIYETLASLQERVAMQKIPASPIHGAMRIEQFVTRDNEFALLDLDAASIGDPLFDVVEFITSLQYLEFLRGMEREALACAENLFLESYKKHALWELDDLRIAWYACAFFMTKIYDTVKNLEQNSLPNLDKAFDVLEQWHVKLLHERAALAPESMVA